MARPEAPVDRIEVRAYRVPTEGEQTDGTLRWSSTGVVVVLAHGGGASGIGLSYAHAAAAHLVEDRLRSVVEGQDAMSPPACNEAMVHALRNTGREGIGSMAVSAVDNALWDLKARLLELPLDALLGARRSAVPVYGSGGFCNFDDERLAAQLRGWVEAGIPRVKLKVGRDPRADPHRVAVARRAVGDDTELFTDANGAYTRRQARELAHTFREEYGVVWLEEPRPSDDHDGLRTLRRRAPAGLDIAGGEYGWQPRYFERMVRARCVDVLQPDVTRCEGITAFLEIAALCAAAHVPISAHCAPSQTVHAAAAAPALRHVEYFADHTRIERMFFDGVLDPVDGALRPDHARPGNGLTLKERDAERFRVPAG